MSDAAAIASPPAATVPLIAATGISKSFHDVDREIEVLKDLSFIVQPGELIAIVGQSGTGKATLLKVIAGEEYSDTGEAKVHAGARLGVLRQVAEFPAGRTLFAEAKSAFDELLAAQHEADAGRDHEQDRDFAERIEGAERQQDAGDDIRCAEIARLAHEAGELVLADGAQLVPHHPVDVTALGADFLVFSGHKMLGPLGLGVLYGRRDRLE
ncbi:aminotransferase class V-fold PLP-dependent enzyme, partial [Lacticaseibacillus rhamnosus]